MASSIDGFPKFFQVCLKRCVFSRFSRPEIQVQDFPGADHPAHNTHFPLKVPLEYVPHQNGTIKTNSTLKIRRFEYVPSPAPEWSWYKTLRTISFA